MSKVSFNPYVAKIVADVFNEALKLGYLEKVAVTGDRRRHDFRPTEPMLKAWRNYCNALLTKPEFSYALKLAQTLISMRDLEAQSAKQNM